MRIDATIQVAVQKGIDSTRQQTTIAGLKRLRARKSSELEMLAERIAHLGDAARDQIPIEGGQTSFRIDS